MRKTSTFLLVAIMLMSSVTLSFADTTQLGLFTDLNKHSANTGLSISDVTLNKDGLRSFSINYEDSDIT